MRLLKILLLLFLPLNVFANEGNVGHPLDWIIEPSMGFALLYGLIFPVIFLFFHFFKVSWKFKFLTFSVFLVWAIVLIIFVLLYI